MGGTLPVTGRRRFHSLPGRKTPDVAYIKVSLFNYVILSLIKFYSVINAVFYVTAR